MLINGSDLVMLIITWTICLIIYIVVNWFISNEFYNIARMKGHESKKYFWFPFLFGIIGYLLVIALPVVNNDVIKNINKIKKDDYVPVCGNCGNSVGEDDKECSNCGAKFE